MVYWTQNEFGDKRETKHGVEEEVCYEVGFEDAGGAAGRLAAGEPVESGLGRAWLFIREA